MVNDVESQEVDSNHVAWKIGATYEGQEPGIEEDVGHVNIHGVDEMHQVTAIIRWDLWT